ncbi:MAG: metallophosphoesterase [Bacteroidota bacterium]
MKRRKFLKRLAILGGIGATTGFYTWQLEPHWLEIVRRKMAIKHLPISLIGKTLVQISDIHVGREVNADFLRNSFKRVAALEPDLVVYTGDYVSYENASQLEQLQKVLDHAVLGQQATLAILGNHDYGHRFREPEVADKIVDILKEAGIKTLRNEREMVAGLNVIGLDDSWGTNFHPRAALAHYRSDQANLILCHNPDVCDMDVWNGYQGWILSGHTHGGQCKPPFLPPPILPVRNKNYSAGEIDLEDGRMLYINRALGHSKQVRFNVRPEITVFELNRA